MIVLVSFTKLHKIGDLEVPFKRKLLHLKDFVGVLWSVEELKSKLKEEEV
ncbi:hypothetical protein HMPREF0653_00799 [Prevotella disiens JCM 6334 = ATCC 29426]|uniref:Uncharacterized protein n=1 Tax=Prevotella disiens JCM 6334 = ATCC 29426 TaxID=1235811 RepID=A0ABN0NTU3_9BACT|nr:hypothetical protein HMPREF0653_00799 [Prevotella disiens JCM 6334 = ATCC 29426]